MTFHQARCSIWEWLLISTCWKWSGFAGLMWTCKFLIHVQSVQLFMIHFVKYIFCCMDGLPYSALICCLHFWSSSLILNIRISEFELLTVAYTVLWFGKTNIDQWVCGHNVLSLRNYSWKSFFSCPHFFHKSDWRLESLECEELKRNYVGAAQRRSRGSNQNPC